MIKFSDLTGVLFHENEVVIILKGSMHGPFDIKDKDKILAQFDKGAAK